MRRARTWMCAASAAVWLVAASASGAGAQDITIGAWAARCDAGQCRASLASASGREALLVARFAGSDGISIGFVTPATVADRERPVTVRIDGKQLDTLTPDREYRPLERVESFWIVDGRTAAAVVAALLKGKQLRIEYLDVSGAPHDADFDLAQFDEVVARFEADPARPKGRREGVAPPKAIAAAPTATKAELIIRMGLPQRLHERHMAASDCEDPNSPLLKPIQPVVGPLSKTAMLYAIPCSSSGGNVSYKLWVVESGEIGGMTPVFFALYDQTFGWKGVDLLPNVKFDDKQARLTAVTTARQDTGCGGFGAWRWKDYAFAMEDYRVSTACGGAARPEDWPRVFPK